MKTATFALLTAAAVTTAANADFVDMKFLGTGRGDTVRATHLGSTRDLFAGQLNHRISGGAGATAAMNGDHLTFCSDFYQYVSSSYTQYEIVGLEAIPSSQPMGAAKAAALRSLYASAGSAALASNANTTLAAAFQVAVWEIVTDFDGTAGSLNLAAGDFKASRTNGQAFSGAMATQLGDLFAAAVSPAVGGPSMIGLKSGSNQDQILVGFQVPAPGAMAVMGLGALGLGRRRR